MDVTATTIDVPPDSGVDLKDENKLAETQDASDFVIERIESIEGLRALESEWRQLCEASDTSGVFLTWEWVEAWFDSFGNDLQPWILAARDSESRSIIGIVPLVLRRRPFRIGPCREISMVGNAVGGADHLDIIACSNHMTRVAEEFVRYLRTTRRSWDIFRLDGVSEDSIFAKLLRRQSGWTANTWESVCPYLELPGSYDTFFQGLKRERRANFRRRAKRLAESVGGDVEYRQVKSASELPDALSHVFRLHQQVRESHGQAGAFNNPAIREFHQRYCENLLAKDALRLFLLRAGDQTIAMAYCFKHKNKMFFYQTGYEPAWSKYGPGNAIVGFAIQCAIEEGLTEFDFLRGAEPYKRDWTSSARRNLRMRIAGTRIWGPVIAAASVARRCKKTLNQWRRRAFGLPGTDNDAELFPRDAHATESPLK